MSETIVALATAHGVGSIAIVRLSGTRALELALKLTHKKELSPRKAYLCSLFSKEGDFIDEAIVLYFKAPHSFTGEDIVEFQIHGGFSTSELLIEECLKFKVRLASPGEFSKRACLNGKMSVLKALCINELIHSKSSLAAKIIAKNLEGKLGSMLDNMRLELVKTLAFVETSIDYADDDLPQDLLLNIRKMCEKNASFLEEIAHISQSKKGLIEGFKIAIIGKPNVGKSSLLNSLLSYERAIVSPLAGTTRDRVEESLKIGTHLVRIVDTAGIRKSTDKIENLGIELSFKALQEADIILALFDGSRAKDEEDEKILEQLSQSDKKIFYILNKSDLKQEFKPLDKDFIKLSAKNSSKELRVILQTYLDSFDTEGIMITNLALIEACFKASKALQRAKNLLEESSLELFAFELNLAINELAKFTKDFDREEILNEMFANFCLGK